MTPSLSAPRQLTAGPVRMTLVDGELRYLYLGDREIVRRLYFCVRFHDKWDTARNEITRCDVAEKDGGFVVDLAARAVTGPVNYGWSARISGTPDGAVSFATSGAAITDCQHIRRAGLQLLLGAEAVIGQPFVMTRPDGSALRQELQTRLDPDVMPMQFQKLSYTTREGVDVQAEFTGTTYGYEDQRNFNDSSFKFFSAHGHSYPTLIAGVRAESSVSLRLTGGPARLGTGRSLCARIESMTGGARVPRITEAGATTPDSLFITLNKNRATHWDSKLHTWGFTPAVNLYDDDTFMENAAAILAQIRTARVFTNPHGTDIGCRLDPVHFESLHPRPARDERNHTVFAAAWLVACVKYAALGAALDVAFRVGPGPVDAVRATLAARAGRAVLLVSITAPARQPVEAFGIVDPTGQTELWFANITGQPIELPVERVTPGQYAMRRVNAADRWDATSSHTIGVTRSLTLRMQPHEVCVLTPI